MQSVESRRITMVVEHPMTGVAALQLVDIAAELPFERFDMLHLSLRQVEQVDVTGVVALVRVFSHVRRFGKRIRFTDANDAVAELLESVGLTAVVEVLRRSDAREPSTVVQSVQV